MRTQQSWPTTPTAPETPYISLPVVCNGRPGTITNVYGGDLKGMVEVRLESGTVCVSWSEVGVIETRWQSSLTDREEGRAKHE